MATGIITSAPSIRQPLYIVSCVSHNGAKNIRIYERDDICMSDGVGQWVSLLKISNRWTVTNLPYVLPTSIIITPNGNNAQILVVSRALKVSASGLARWFCDGIGVIADIHCVINDETMLVKGAVCCLWIIRCCTGNYQWIVAPQQIPATIFWPNGDDYSGMSIVKKILQETPVHGGLKKPKRKVSLNTILMKNLNQDSGKENINQITSGVKPEASVSVNDTSKLSKSAKKRRNRKRNEVVQAINSNGSLPWGIGCETAIVPVMVACDVTSNTVDNIVDNNEPFVFGNTFATVGASVLMQDSESYSAIIWKESMFGDVGQDNTGCSSKGRYTTSDEEEICSNIDSPSSNSPDLRQELNPIEPRRSVGSRFSARLSTVAGSFLSNSEYGYLTKMPCKEGLELGHDALDEPSFDYVNDADAYFSDGMEALEDDMSNNITTANLQLLEIRLDELTATDESAEILGRDAGSIADNLQVDHISNDDDNVVARKLIDHDIDTLKAGLAASQNKIESLERENAAMKQFILELGQQLTNFTHGS